MGGENACGRGLAVSGQTGWALRRRGRGPCASTSPARPGHDTGSARRQAEGAGGGGSHGSPGKGSERMSRGEDRRRERFRYTKGTWPRRRDDTSAARSRCPMDRQSGKGPGGRSSRARSAGTGPDRPPHPDEGGKCTPRPDGRDGLLTDLGLYQILPAGDAAEKVAARAVGLGGG